MNKKSLKPLPTIFVSLLNDKKLIPITKIIDVPCIDPDCLIRHFYIEQVWDDSLSVSFPISLN